MPRVAPEGVVPARLASRQLADECQTSRREHGKDEGNCPAGAAATGSGFQRERAFVAHGATFVIVVAFNRRAAGPFRSEKNISKNQ